MRAGAYRCRRSSRRLPWAADGDFGVNYERKVEAMDSLAGSTPSFYDEGESRRKRTRLIVALVLIGFALAATWYAFTHRGTGAATAEGADGAAAQSVPNVTVVIPGRVPLHRRWFSQRP